MGRPIRSSLELCELSDLCSLVAHLRLYDNGDSWECIIDDSRAFSVKMMRSYINQKFPTLHVPPTRWNTLLPLKVNIFIWRTTNKRLPTRANLDYKGIDLDSVPCPTSDDAIETEDHIFVSCSIAKDTWKCIADWPPRVTLGRLLPHARGLGSKPRRGGFPSGAKKKWGLSPKCEGSSLAYCPIGCHLIGIVAWVFLAVAIIVGVVTYHGDDPKSPSYSIELIDDNEISMTEEHGIKFYVKSSNEFDQKSIKTILEFLSYLFTKNTLAYEDPPQQD
nr:RNA-directed DNA polymerase, eukaryota, reverse transcriptase zinc-binding domain protein [Tanacetum cinerariifolium]